MLEAVARSSMKCLVINLDRSVSRLAHITDEFARIGMPFERVSAIDAADGILPSSRLTAPEVACFLSHRKCWQMIADGVDQYGAIFEDDVVLSSDAGELLSNDAWVPRDADVIKLETFFAKVRLRRRRMPVHDAYSLARLVGRHLGSAGYIVTKTAARALLERTGQLKAPVDHALFCPINATCSRNTIYQLVPALCAQGNLTPGGGFQSLIQLKAPREKRTLREKVLKETSRAFAHLRNGTYWRTERIEVALRVRTGPRPRMLAPPKAGPRP